MIKWLVAYLFTHWFDSFLNGFVHGGLIRGGNFLLTFNRHEISFFSVYSFLFKQSHRSFRSFYIKLGKISIKFCFLMKIETWNSNWHTLIFAAHNGFSQVALPLCVRNSYSKHRRTGNLGYDTWYMLQNCEFLIKKTNDF